MFISRSASSLVEIEIIQTKSKYLNVKVLLARCNDSRSLATPSYLL